MLVGMMGNGEKRLGIKHLLRLAAVVLCVSCLSAFPDTKAKTLRGQYETLIKEYESARTKYFEAAEHAKTDAQREKLVYPSPDQYAERFLAIAREEPKDPAALEALVWVATSCRGPQQQTALDLLLANHVQSTNLARVADALIYSQSTEADNWLRSVLQQSPHHEVKGHVTYCLARHLTTKDRAAAEKLFEEVVANYSDVSSYRSTIAEAAKGELFEIRSLAIGQVAPEIEGSDADGKNFKLSDYRGKVVVIDFWGDW
jgi:hypothetical protein